MIYAPIIEQNLPAFTNIEAVTIPIEQNPLIQPSDFDGYALRVFSTIGNEITTNVILNSNNTFDLSDFEEQISKNWYYKVQIAYIKNNVAGPYTALANIKYTSQPDISVNYNGINNQYIISYSNEDKTEKLLSYSLKVTSIDNLSTVKEDTSEILAISEAYNEETNTYTYIYQGKNTLAENQEYLLQFSYKTNNIVGSYSNYIYGIELPISGYEGLVYINNIEINENNGLNKIVISTEEYPEPAHFILVKKDVKKDYYEDVIKFDITNNDNNIILYDNNLEANHKYLYEIQQINKYGIRSKPFGKTWPEELIINNFPHMFLQDSEHQLCIKFNPDISSFKDNIQEQKVETIGNKYPVFYRNANIKYKEFPINGLISINMDENQLFIKYKSPLEIGVNEQITNLTADNVNAELEFKLKVMEWLNNGKLKLLRSPTEGNYIVRLMNISLSPEKTLGRILHSFSATAYEVAEYNIQNLINNQLLDIEINKQNELSHIWRAIPKTDENLFPFSDHTEPEVATQFIISNGVPGNQFTIQFADGSQDNIQLNIGDVNYLYKSDKLITMITQDSLNSKLGEYQIWFKEYVNENDDDFNKIKAIKYENVKITGTLLASGSSDLDNNEYTINDFNDLVFVENTLNFYYLYFFLPEGSTQTEVTISYTKGEEQSNPTAIVSRDTPLYIRMPHLQFLYPNMKVLELNGNLNFELYILRKVIEMESVPNE